MKSTLTFHQRAYIRFIRDSYPQPSWSEVGKRVGCTIDQARYWYNRGDDIGDHTSTGRPPKVTSTIKEEIKAITHLSPTISSISLGRHYNLSEETVREIRHSAGFRFINYIHRVPLSREHKLSRVIFSKYHLANPQEMKKIVFTDESMICAAPRDKKIWRIPGDYSDQYFLQFTSRPIKRMIWGCIGYNFKSQLILIEGSVNSQSYIKYLLDSNIFSQLNKFYGYDGYIYQQDNAPAHMSFYTE